MSVQISKTNNQVNEHMKEEELESSKNMDNDVQKKRKLEEDLKDSSHEKSGKQKSNKNTSTNIQTINFESSTLAKTTTSSKQQTKQRKFLYKLSINNPNLFLKFINAIASAVSELKILVVVSEQLTGLSIESHDSYMHIASKSKFSCSVNIPDNSSGKNSVPPIYVLANTFLQTLTISDTIGDSILNIIKYEDTPDKLFFECTSDENDASSSWSCDLLDSTHLESLEGIKLTLHYHVNIKLKSLKQLCANAKKSGSNSLLIELYQSKDHGDENILHSMLCIGFTGTATSGTNKFYQSARKKVTEENNQKKIEWVQLTGLTEDQRDSLKYELKSSNEYDNNKLRLFLNHMDIEWVLLHLCDDSSEQPLVLDCILADKNTKHCIIVAPKVKKESL
jgi:hypothetical protein